MATLGQASQSASDVLIGSVDSPQKKQKVSDDNRATNFKLGLSGKSSKKLNKYRATGCAVSEARASRELLTRCVPPVHSDTASDAVELEALSLRSREPHFQEVPGADLPQG